MLKVNNIEVIYSDVILVLKGLSLVVPEGQIVALLGAIRADWAGPAARERPGSLSGAVPLR